MATLIGETALSALVIRAKYGEAEAFATLCRMFLHPAYSVALAIVGRPADAEDVAQDAFVVALERIGTCQEPERFAGWLLQIVRNRARNWLERRRLRDVAQGPDTPGPAVEAVRPEQTDLKQRLVEALGHLSTVQREVVLLHDMEEWTHAEIGAALDMSEVMSRQHLFQARRVLRGRLAEDALAEDVHERG